MNRRYFHSLRLLNQWLERRSALLGAWASVVSIVGVPLVLLGGALAYIQLTGYLARPDVTMALGGKGTPVLYLFNVSNVLARDVTQQLLLYDLNVAAESKPDDAGNLLIPTSSTPYIRPHSQIGPSVLQTTAPSLVPLRAGHVLFGWGMVQCPDCAQPHYYWLYFAVGKGGWCSEINEADLQYVSTRLADLLAGRSDLQTLIKQVAPVQKRRIVQEPWRAAAER